VARPHWRLLLLPPLHGDREKIEERDDDSDDQSGRRLTIFLRLRRSGSDRIASTLERNKEEDEKAKPN
jgi:hypothetical protein